MPNPLKSVLASLLAFLFLVFSGTAEPTDPARSISLLKQRLLDIDSELTQLATSSMRSGVGTVGYRSLPNKEASHKEWVEVQLEGLKRVEQIVLVPTIWRDTKTGFQAEGFPENFDIVLEHDGEETVVASFDESDKLLPRIAPLVVPINPTLASSVKIIAHKLIPRPWDGLYTLQLAELMVFSGDDNLALGQPVHVSSYEKNNKARSVDSVVDGFVPYLMDAASGNQSIAMITPNRATVNPHIILDLAAEFPLDRLHWHPPELSDTVPEATETGLGIPKKLRIEGAMQSDFSDAQLLLELETKSIYDIGNMIARRFKKVTCRYVRISAVEPDLLNGRQMGFAEIELFANGRNVALDKAVSGNMTLGPDRSYAHVTDGLNLYGKILSQREWMRQLARRHDLEQERPLIAKALAQAYERQRLYLNALIWIAVLLTVGIAFTILISRMLQARRLAGIRERFAADLHDELGANIHTIGLLNDIALSAIDTPERLTKVLHQCRDLTQRTGTAVRHCIDLQKAEGLYDSLPGNMRRAAERIMVELEHELNIENEAFFDSLHLRAKSDLFLFYKECLVNISRHAEATRFKTHLYTDKNYILLTVQDNGLGMTEIPASLLRRAHLLKAKIRHDHPPDGGTRITLKLKIRRNLLTPSPNKKQ